MTYTDKNYRKFTNQCKKWWDTEPLTLNSLYLHLGINKNIAYKYKARQPKLYAILQTYKYMLVDKLENILITANPKTVNVRGIETYLRNICPEYRQSYQEQEVLKDTKAEETPVLIDWGNDNDLQVNMKWGKND